MTQQPGNHVPVALVTGASRGLGAELVRQLTATGYHCIVLAHTIGALEALDDEVRKAGGHALTIVPLDLGKDHDKIDQLGAELFQRFGQLDLFVSNAATLGGLSPVGHIEPKKWDQLMAVNVTANYRLIRSLDPLLRQAKSSQALFMTCSQGSMAEAFWGSFAASKAALERLAACYALENRQTGINVRVVDPGIMPTQLRRDAFPGIKTNDQTAVIAAARKILADAGLLLSNRMQTAV